MSKDTESGPWVIVVDEMTYQQARDLGKVLGAHKVTGHFLRGKVADYMSDYTQSFNKRQASKKDV